MAQKCLFVVPARGPPRANPQSFDMFFGWGLVPNNEIKAVAGAPLP